MFDAKADKDTDAVVGNLYQAVAGGGYEDSGIAPADKADVTEVNALINPLQISQAINMTAAASGSNGIKVLNDDNINFGTGDFTLVWRGSLPDWTPGSTQNLLAKQGGSPSYQGFALQLLSDTTFRMQLIENNATAASTNLFSTESIVATDGTIVSVVIVIDISSDSAYFYVNGILFGDALSLGGYQRDVSNTGIFYLLGTDGVRTASNTQFAALYNRALSADDVAYLYKNGIHPADMWGSQTNQISNPDLETNDTGWTASNSLGGATYSAGRNTTNPITGSGDYKIAVTSPGTSTVYPLIDIDYSDTPTLKNKTAKLSFDYKVNSGSCNVFARHGAAGDYFIPSAFQLTGTGSYTVDVLLDDSDDNDQTFLRLQFDGTKSFDCQFDNISVKQVGATAAYLPENIQPVPGQWLDASSNKLHALMPAAGCTLMRPKNTFRYEYILTWTASAAAQPICGSTQDPVTTDDHFIERIITENQEETNLQNVSIGDESDGARYMASATPGTLNTPTKQTVAAATPDGTNYQLLATPAATATMTVKFIIEGIIL